MRAEHPSPQFVRENWVNLNGSWDFEFDDNDVGEQEKWYQSHPFSQKINVPFCFQSKLSGIGIIEFHDIVWYRTTVDLPVGFKGKRALLHFGAVDYEATVWVNGEKMIHHVGGHVPFSIDITKVAKEKDNHIVLRVYDDSRDMKQPRGKQYWKEKSESIFYTRTTGIWQTVWLEAVSQTYIGEAFFTPDIDRGEVQLAIHLDGFQRQSDVSLTTRIIFEGTPINEQTVKLYSKESVFTLDVKDKEGQIKKWDPDRPHLYDIALILSIDGQVVDEVQSYFGMRKVATHQGVFYLNNRSYTMRLVLDQGYFEDGILTPPSDEDIKKDVELTKAMGFNGARKHQKVEDPRYLYWCDKLGLLVWGEMANSFGYSEAYVSRFTDEWQKVIKRDYNHPCIVQGFCYTQLTDVEQEINGLLTYRREPKIPIEEIRKIVKGETLTS